MAVSSVKLQIRTHQCYMSSIYGRSSSSFKTILQLSMNNIFTTVVLFVFSYILYFIYYIFLTHFSQLQRKILKHVHVIHRSI